jgi:hypothetical protein
MSVIYSGLTIINTTLDGSSQTALNTALAAALVSAGWTVIVDGSSTGIWRLRSAATPSGLQGDVWLWNQTSGSGTLPALMSVASLLSTIQTTTGGTLYQNSTPFTLTCGTGFTYQLIATGYYFYLIRTTIPCPAQASAFFCTPYQPSNVTGLIASNVVGAGSSTTSDTLGSAGLLSTNSFGLAFCYLNGGGHTAGTAFNLWAQTAGGFTVPSAQVTWFDGSVEFYEPRVMGVQTNGSGGASGTTKAIGFMWDALVMNQASPRGTTISYDSGTWMVLTESINPSLLIKIA